ncbi:G surface protein, allelic form 156-like [Ochlerotatus camptorhynchus]|uniref:G surface protein, allelic form 156-like n=1 Tax=Ochlerotatus camptorhynchus TaxID=644619 RepID=UPI0031DD7058
MSPMKRFGLLIVVIFQLAATIGATRCASCSSAVDPKCSKAGYDDQTKECYNVNPCAVSIITGTGHTFRGCSADAECYQNELCDTCDGDDCNTGTYPPGRMSCLTCSSTGEADCEQLSDIQQFSAACMLHFEDGSCVTVFKDFKPFVRGCLGDMDAGVKTICESGSAECVVCRENDCNAVNVRPDEQCLQCDSQDRGCNNGSHVVTACGKVSDGKCYSKMQSDGTIKRGCLHELSAQELAACNSTRCIVCSGLGCNNDVFVTRNGFRCKTCNSEAKPACVRDPYTVLDKVCPVNDTTCATVLISATGHLFRGCSSEAECVAEGDACIKCNKYQNCNFYRYPEGRLECYVCETSANQNCATLPINKQFEKECLRHIPGDQCVTVFDGFRVIRRECKSGLNPSDLVKCDSTSDKECVTCTGVGCNKIRVRMDDSCLQCSSNDALNCANGRRVSTVCKKSSGGVCYNRLNVDGTLQRGCMSDLNEEEQKVCQDLNDQSCETCSGVGCNSNLFPANALQCVQCDSETNMDCVQEQAEGALVNPCTHQITGDRCYTRLRNDGSIERGCQSSLPVPCNPQLNMSCSVCDGSACNTEVFPWGRRSCFQCDGLSDLTCGLEQKRSEDAKVCVRFQPQDKCYTLLENGRVMRGCSSEFQVDVCTGFERTQCQTCATDHCNKVSEIGLRATGWRNQANVLAVIMLILCMLFP